MLLLTELLLVAKQVVYIFGLPTGTHVTILVASFLSYVTSVTDIISASVN
jgi:hypothetical protein